MEKNRWKRTDEKTYGKEEMEKKRRVWTDLMVSGADAQRPRSAWKLLRIVWMLARLMKTISQLG